MGGACSAHGGDKKSYKILVGSPEGKRPLGRPRHRWEDNIKIDLREEVFRVGIELIWLRIGTGDGLS
jgi:hypothetical protein